jgi:hypothetical protein
MGLVGPPHIDNPIGLHTQPKHKIHTNNPSPTVETEATTVVETRLKLREHQGR